MKSKTLEQYCNLSVALKFSLVLLILNLCYPAQVCSKNIVPLSFLGRTTGRINNHMLDKLINLYQKGKKSSLNTKNWSLLWVLLSWKCKDFNAFVISLSQQLDDGRPDGLHEYFHNYPENVIYVPPPSRPMKRLPKRGSSDEELLSYLRGMDGASELMSMLQADQK